MERAANSSLMRSINRSAILELIRKKSPISRSQIAGLLRMSMPTVMRIVEELIDEDFVAPIGNLKATKGRPSALLEFNANSHVVLGVDLSGPEMVGELSDLNGAVQHELSFPYRDEGPEAHVERLFELIEKLLHVPLKPEQKFRGIGIGAPGATTYPEGIVQWAPIFGWKDLPLKDILSKRFDLPVFVEHDVNLAVLGEMGFGAAIGHRNAVCIIMGVGIGAGIIVDGSIYRGNSHHAGEIACMVPGIEFLGKSYDRFGPLGNLILNTAAAGKKIQSNESGGNSGSKNGQGGVAETFQAARRGEGWAREILEKLIDYLGLMAANIVALLDPEIIILGGELAPASDLLVDPIMGRLKGIVAHMPRIVGSSLYHRAVVMGAIMLVLNTTTRHTVVQRRP